MPDTKPDGSTEALAQVLAGHAALLWGDEKAANLQESLTQTARMLLDIGRRPPGSDTEPGCYPASQSSKEAAQ
jgi:hypothetical protein